MHNKDQYPEIWQAMEAAKAKLAPLVADRELHMAKVDETARKMDALKAEKVEHHDCACVNLPEITALRKQIGKLGRIMNGPQQQ